VGDRTVGKKPVGKVEMKQGKREVKFPEERQGTWLSSENLLKKKRSGNGGGKKG